jgi:hypothetical protein
MKWPNLLIALVLAGLPAGCAQVPAQPTVVPVAPTVEPITPTPEIFMPVPDEIRAEVAAREALAQHLGVELAAVTVRKIAETDWPDSCLGLTLPGQACQIGAVAGFRIVLEANAAAYEVRTDRASQTVLVFGRVDPTLGALPAVCQGIGQGTFYSPENGICFAYPASFTLGEMHPTRSELFGPPLDESAVALRATLLFEVQAVGAGDDLESIVDAYVDQFQGLDVPEMTRTSMLLGGEPAERLEVVPGREGSRDVFVLRDSALYHFMFMPSVTDFPQAAEEVENLFMTVTSSFTFLPAPAG